MADAIFEVGAQVVQELSRVGEGRDIVHQRPDLYAALVDAVCSLFEQIGDTHELQLSRLPGAKHAALTLVELANVRAPFEWPVVRLGDVASPSGSEAKDVKFAAILSATVKRLMAIRAAMPASTTRPRTMATRARRQRACMDNGAD